MRFFRRLLPLIAAAICSQATTAAFAQFTEVTVAAGDRDAQYAELARDVEALDREFSLIKRVVKLVSPTVVHIEATLLPRYRGMMEIEEAGSGVIVELGPDSTPYVITNRHVIRHSSQELVNIHLADGRVVRPTRIWSDKETDVAVMALEEPNLTPARIGDSEDLEIGDFVLAIGSPFGLSQSVTRGIVSAKGRHNLDLGDGDLKWQNFIQTDAAINPGNSGGPLVNLKGEVVGLNTAIASASGGNEGIGFSIPINIVARIASQLVDSNAVARGFLGVKLDSRFGDDQARQLGLSRPVGTRITVVEPQSPAEKAELRVNDVILQYNGVRVESDDHLIGLVKLTEVGERIPLRLYREGKPLDLFVEIGDLRDYTAPQ